MINTIKTLIKSFKGVRGFFAVGQLAVRKKCQFRLGQVKFGQVKLGQVILVRQVRFGSARFFFPTVPTRSPVGTSQTVPKAKCPAPKIPRATFDKHIYIFIHLYKYICTQIYLIYIHKYKYKIPKNSSYDIFQNNCVIMSICKYHTD